MVHKFEHQFADEHDLSKNPDQLSRRILPGFFNVLLLMFGEERLASYEREAHKIIDELTQKKGGRVAWSEIYKAPKMRKLCFRAEIENRTVLCRDRQTSQLDDSGHQHKLGSGRCARVRAVLGADADGR